MLYLHAYQSYIWNKMATFRLETFGFEPIAGDLVLLQRGGMTKWATWRFSTVFRFFCLCGRNGRRR